MAFVSTNKAPGVYIDEIQLPGPIAGAPTSTTAFIGPAQMGALLKPTPLTNKAQFAQVFGSYIEDPYRVYATHAVNGFFDEGGNLCYFVRVGTGVQATLNLADRRTAGPQTTLVVTALKEGTAGNNITVQVDDASISGAIKATRQQVALVSASGTKAQIALADASKFSPGDIVLLEQGANSDRAMIVSIATGVPTATDATINLASALVNTYTGGDLRTADLAPGQQRIRLASVTGLQVGSFVKISQTLGGTPPTETGVVRLVDAINSSITLTSGLTNNYSHKSGDPDINVQSLEFTLTIAGSITEVFKNLSMDSRHTQYFGNIVTSQQVDVELADPPSTTPPANNMPKAIGAAPLTGGVADNINNLTTAHYHTGVDTLLRVNDVALLAIPDSVGSQFKKADTQDIQAYMVAHCEKVVNRFAILDPLWEDPNKALDVTGIIAQRASLNSDRGMASLYYPWIFISNPLGSGRVLVPPSGHMAGIYANNDNTRGVFKAPANEAVVSALDLAHQLTDDEQGPLNEQGIDVIRFFPGRGVRVWGARTIAPSDVTQWRYNSIRRFTNFVEASLRDGTRFAVFEPNNPTLWGQVKRLVTDFLNQQWQLGALEGTSADQGFIVKVDSTLNTPDVIALGQLIIQVTLFTVPPAEFVVFQIIQEPGGSAVSE